MSNINICNFEYKRYSHIITIVYYNKPSKYIIFGDKYNEMNDIIKDNEYIHLPNVYIEEDDTIEEILNKISYELTIEKDKLHIYATNTGQNNATISLNYNYFILSGRPTVVKNIDIIPNIFDFDLSKINKLDENIYKPYTNKYINLINSIFIINKKNLENNLISVFNLNKYENKNTFYNNIKIIIYNDVYNAINTKYNKYDIKKQFLNLYFLDLSQDLSTKISHVNFNNLKNELIENKKQIDMIYNNYENNLPNKYKKFLIKSTPCNIIESIIHINYENNYDFIDLSKIFHSFRLTDEIPFVKFKEDSSKLYQIRFNKNLYNNESNIYISNTELKNWIFKIKSKYKLYDDIIVNVKGLSYKIFLYKNEDNVNKYLTLNIYKNGKIEIKCYWSDLYNNSINDILSAVKKAKDFIKEINKIDYQLIGISKNKLIEEPDINFLNNKYSNTKLISLNVNYDIITHSKINYIDYIKYISQFSLFINYIEQNKDEIGTNIELRYKRINEFIKLDKINSFIYKLQKAGYLRDDILLELEKYNNITRDVAKNYYNKYLLLFKNINKNIENDNNDNENLDNNNNILDNEIIKNKNPGTDIKILYKNNNLYKIIILGCTLSSISYISNFIKSSIEQYFIYNTDKNIIQDKNNNIKMNKNIFNNKLFNFDEDETENENNDDNDNNNYTNEYYNTSINDESKYDENENNFEYKKEPTGNNLLSRLKFSNTKIFYDDKYKDNSYSRKCQQNIKRPLVISSNKANIILQKQKKLLEEEKKKNNKNKINEIEKNIKLLENDGRHIEGYFYFCPAKWDIDNYEPISDKSKNIIYKEDYTKLGFMNELCQPCCMKEHSVFKHNINDVYCKNKYNNDNDNNELNNLKKLKIEKENNKLKSYILDSSKIFEKNENRYILLPDELSYILNYNKNCKIIKNDYTCYLRKTIKPGNYFLNALCSINNITPDIIYERINNLISNDDKNKKIYRSLKSGAINIIFIEDNILNNSKYTSIDLVKLSVYKYLEYIKNNIDKIDEIFLWDVISKKNIILEDENINIFIIEAFYENQNILTNLKIKCPVGYDIDILYNENYKSIILYKYISIITGECQYEIICNCKYNNKKIISDILFPPNNNIIIDLIKQIKLCKPTNNYNYYEEYKKYLNNPKNSTIIDTLQDMDIEKLNINSYNIYYNNMIKLYPLVFDDYKIKDQIIDRYNNVRFIILFNNAIIPITPSPVSLDYSIKYQIVNNYQSYENTIKHFIILEHFGLIKGLKPFCFLINPGNDIFNKKNSLVTGIILINGSYVNISPHILLSEAIKIKFNIKILDNVKPIIFDSETLLFKENNYINDILITNKDILSQYMFNDEFIVDRELLFNKNIKDDRIKYTIRHDYENHTYDLLRYEFSKYIQNEKKQKYKEQILNIINNDIFKNIDKKNKLLYIITKIIKKIIVLISEINDEEYIKLLENNIGPLKISFNDIILNNDSILQDSNYSYNYIKPNLKTICKLNNNNNFHCFNKKLIISDINLINGNNNNLNNYIYRLIDELISNNIKKTEIINDLIDNSISNIPYIENEVYITSENIVENNENINDIIDNFYKIDISITDKNNEHYLIKNINNDKYNMYSNLLINDKINCIKEHKILPNYWINKLKDTRYHILVSLNSKCVFNLIKKAKESMSNNIYINDLKISIKSFIIENRNIKYNKIKNDNRTFSELVQYAYFDRYINTKFNKLFDVENSYDFLNAILNEERDIVDIDLNFISRILNVKFIILCDPEDDTLYKSGIKCLNTTQTLSDIYILLFKNKFNEYNIIADTYYSTYKTIFTKDELNDVLLYDLWKTECGKSDDDIYTHKINKIFKPNRYISEDNFIEENNKIIINNESSFNKTKNLTENSANLYSESNEFI